MRFERQPDDGPVSVERISDGLFVQIAGVSFVVSPYNAVRVASAICIVLGLTVSNALRRAIL